MSCEQYERDLALAVEGDLPERESASLERHLQHCVRCQQFLGDLKQSQRKLKDLAAEPVEEATLAGVRKRVAAVLQEPARPPWVVPASGWALAASLAVVALGLAVALWRTTPRASRQSSGATAAPRAVGVTSVTPAVSSETRAVTRTGGRPEGAAARLHRRVSTAPPPGAVSHGVEMQTRRVAPDLSPEDAEQLARAVVAVSRIRRLRERPPSAPAEPSPGTTVRLSTSDPGVVIYWQLDSNGG
jgi:anti-sigma factor RsiW